MPDSAARENGSLAAAPPGSLGITAVEYETGINKETLRVWERRYGFPTPWRDSAGERLYPPEQVQQLRLIKRLLDAGHRPGRVITAAPQARAAMLNPAPEACAADTRDPAPEIAACTALLLGHDVDGLRRALSQVLPRRGLAASITEVFAPLTTHVGLLWTHGQLQVFEEQIFSECLQAVLRQALYALPAAAPDGPRVLLTTLPGEGHALRLLMVEALLSLDGAACLSLGVQTPLPQLPAAVAAHRADVIALGFSGFLSPRAVNEGLAQLRALLPARVEIWAGGGSRALRAQGLPDGVRRLDDLAAISSEMARWRKLLESHL